MAGKVLYLLPLGQALAKMIDMYEAGEVKGIIAIALLKDEGYVVLLNDDLSAIEKLGLLEAAKIDITGKALEVI